MGYIGMETTREVLLTRDKNNFNVLRLLAAVGVIITHSYALLGLPERDMLARLTHGLLSFSRLGVYCFFVMSGFLVAYSLQRSHGARAFFWNRFLRIFPGLAVVLMLTVFLLGPLVTQWPLKEYVLRPDTYHYLVGGIILYDIQYNLPGVFKTNPNQGVNGSLWTLPYEWTCYVLLFISARPLKKYGYRAAFGIVLLAVVLRVIVGRYSLLPVINWLKLDTRQLLLYSTLFFSGAGWLSLRRYVRFRAEIWLGLLLLLVGVSFLFRGAAFYLMLAIVPYATLSLAAAPLPERIRTFFVQADYSYGVYIYAFPVGQLLVYYYRSYLSVASLALLTTVCTLPLAVVSWHVVEKYFLQFKKS